MSQSKKSAGIGAASDQPVPIGTLHELPPTAYAQAYEDEIKAAGTLLGQAALDLDAAIGVLHEAQQCDDPTVLLIALNALLERIGFMVDRGASACTGGFGVRETLDWIMHPDSAATLQALQVRRQERAQSERGAA